MAKRIKCFDYHPKVIETKQSGEKLGFAEDEESSNENYISKFKRNTRINKCNNDILLSSYSSNRCFKTFSLAQTSPWNKIGGYMFISCNETMEKDIKMQLFCLPLSYCDSVRAITPGMPLFLYNETTRQLHGIFEATSFGGYNIDSTVWEDINYKGTSRFPAQVRIRIKKLCKPLEEDAFRPILQNYCDPTASFELSIVETSALLDLYEKHDMKLNEAFGKSKLKERMYPVKTNS
ncbi:B2 protein-like [Phalaenopsis equestris]|uniref:B2 protein-like n=1 Tax=Phalaenopsis equestris TaxID=78828 RepID=UPI0009E447A1|nr:B2 protein-like [Phalaenopsis equestris]